ncbi:MAG: MATE family efflux transporter [Gemmatimonadaceae bacterium]
MSHPQAQPSEWRALIAIALPVVTIQVGIMLMGVVDTIMVGHVNANALASVALGNLYVFNVLVLSMGTLMSLDPLVSQALGARDEVGVTRAIQRGLVLSVLLSAANMLMMIPAAPLLHLFRQPAELVPAAETYVHLNIIGVLPFLVFVVFRQSLQAIGRLAPIVVTVVAANVFNALANWALIFGHLGFPALGVAGSAIATVLGRWFMVAMLLVIAWRELHPHLVSLDRAILANGPLRWMLALGLPIGLQQFLEVSSFAAVGLLMGTFGAVQVASHQIALNLAALTFMVPLGVSAAAAVRVGHAIGAGDAPRSRRAARLSYVVGAGFMCTTAGLFLLFPRPLAVMFTEDETLIAIAATLIPIAGFFQIFDGMQAVGAGVLRGLGDTRVPLVAMLSGYWLIGIPTGLALAYRTEMGPRGLWWGFVAGLAAVAVFLLWRVRTLFRRGVSRVELESPIQRG